MKQFIIAATLLAFSFVSYAFDRSDFVNSIIDSYSDGSRAYNIARTEYGLSGERAEIMAYAIQNVVTNSDFLNFCYNKLLKEGVDFDNIKDRNQLLELIARACISSYQDLMAKGMVRLSGEERRFYFQYNSDRLKQHRANGLYGVCKAVGLADFRFLSISDIKKASKLAASNIPVSELRRYADLMVKSINAEVKEFPRRKVLSTAEMTRAEEQFQNILVTHLQRLSQKEITRLANAIENIETVNAKDSCDATIMLIDSALDVKGNVGDDVLLYMLMAE